MIDYFTVFNPACNIAFQTNIHRDYKDSFVEFMNAMFYWIKFNLNHLSVSEENGSVKKGWVFVALSELPDGCVIYK